ncbi:MAG: hypothetical protein EU547_04550 [Promethearchaeota archaeon]|nr:MAG: hypothetical protein EU547_04550 [Candidatus Lokiarchaeota archaeon]
MNKEKYYKYLFIIGAIFNWIVSSTFLIVSLLIPDIFHLFGTSRPPTLFFLHSLLGLIFVYGIGYFIVGLDINKNRGCVWLGVLSKLSFFTFCVIYFLLRDLELIIVILGSLDFIFACFFIEFLINH